MDLGTLLEKTKLFSDFPGRLKRQELFAINTPLELTYTSKEESLRSYFINLITHFNGKCRNLFRSYNHYRPGIRAGRLVSEGKKNTSCSQVHPLDISTAVFLCCHPVARQDLVLHFWGCRHAFPFLVQFDKSSNPELYFWPIRAILENNSNHECYESVEKPIIQYEVKIISIIRFHKLEESKSLLCNKILARSEKVHSFFFHHDCEGSVSKKSSVCKGLIEAVPHFRSETGPAVYFNLRGNVDKYPVQRQFLCSVSNIIIIMCKTFDKKEIKSIATKCQSSNICELLIVLFTDLSSDNESVSKYSDLDAFSRDLPIEALLIPIRKMKSPDIVQQVSYQIDSASGVVKFNDVLDIARNLDITIDETVMVESLKKAEHISDQILKEYMEHGKTDIFPAQGKSYIDWANVDREIYKLKQWNRVENVKKYRECLEKLKHECRKKQYESVSISDNKSVFALLKLLSSNNLKKKLYETEIIIRYLNISFENATRSTVSQMFTDFKQLFKQIKLNETDETIHSKVADLDEKMSQCVFNISDIVREMGQMYEAIVTMYDARTFVATRSVLPMNIFRKNGEKLRLGLIKEQLPEAAVQLLLLGYPLELMDGRSNSVPILWIQRVLLGLQNRLGNVSVKIVSVLGTQSTGKSTLLNVMFGTQFAVGPGRCTRGVCMHLVKVSDEMKPVCLSDYFIIIDTEGLYSSYISPEQTEERDNTERELATFVIGLSNVTLINIMGENMSYLKDILPICVHAFLRMDLVGLRPKCRLLHHNVDKRNAMNLLEELQCLQSALDQYTEAACKLEQERTRRFGDIIHFDITKSIDYFPPLFDSDLVGCISTAYSREAMELKHTLTRDQSFITLDNARHRIAYLWNAIKTDNFVYEFRNTIETEAQAELDKHTCSAQWSLRQKIQNSQHNFEAEIENCNDSKLLDAIGVKYEESVCELIIQGVKEYSHVLDQTYRHRLLAQAIQKFKFTSLEVFQIAMNEYKKSCFALFRRAIEQKTHELDALYGNKGIILKIDHFLQQKLKSDQISQTRGDHITEKGLFDIWIKQMCEENETIALQDFEEHATNAVYRYFPMHRAKVDTILCARQIGEHSMHTFLKSDQYWSKHMQRFVKQENVEKILQDLIRCKEAIVADIKSRKRFYQADIFRALILDVRNRCQVYPGTLHIKPSFEIDFAISLSGELIQNLKKMETDEILVSHRFMKLAKQYFLSKYREVTGFHTSTNKTVQSFADIILKQTEQYLLTNVSDHLAVSFKEEFPYLQSKHGLLCYVLIQLLDEEDLLPIYLKSPEVGVQCCLSVLFDSYTGINDTNKNSKLHRFLEELVNSTLQTLVKKLVEGIEKRGKRQAHSQVNVVEQCIDIIVSSLDSFVPMNDIRKFLKDTIEETDPRVVLQNLVAKLNEKCLATQIVKSLKFDVLEKCNESIRFETVQITLMSLMGCREECPCCGEMCCIGQEGHPDRHTTIMHRPTGFRKILEGTVIHSATATCWDEVNSATHVKGQFVTSADTLAEGWIIPVDVEIENNSFWKYMLATNIKDLASKHNIEGNVKIPDSWKTLTKEVELRKLNELLKRITKK